MVDPRRDVFRAVHDDARQHRRERRAAVDPEGSGRQHRPASSGRSTATRSASASCSSPAGASATSSAGARMFLTGVTVFALTSATAGLAAAHEMLIVSRIAPGRRRRADDARDALDHHQRLPAERARQGDRHLGRRLRAGAVDSARSSVAFSPSTSPGGRSSSSTSRRDRRDCRHALRGARVARSHGRPRDRLSSASATLTLGLTVARPRSDRGRIPGVGARRASSGCSPLGRRPRRFRLHRAPRQAPIVELPLFASRNFVGTNVVALSSPLRDARHVLLHDDLHAGRARILRPWRPGCASSRPR